MTFGTPVNPNAPADPDFVRAFGAAIMAWNMTDKIVRNLLSCLAANAMHDIDQRAAILTAEMGSRQVSESIKSFAHDVYDGVVASSLKHVADHFDRLLVWRSYYVHGIIFAMPVGDGTPDLKGLISYTTAKGKVAWLNDSVSYVDLVAFFDRCHVLSNFANGVTFHMFFGFGEPSPLPDTPDMPPILTKPLRYTRELRRPRSPSPQKFLAPACHRLH